MLMSNDTYQFERAKAWQHAIRKREKNCTYVSQKKKNNTKNKLQKKKIECFLKGQIYIWLYRQATL